jgi:hypothetical protein
MDLADTQVALVEGGVYYDSLTSLRSRADWAALCERTRPRIRETLEPFGVRGSLDITTAEDGFAFSYAYGDGKHEIQVSEKQIYFEYGRFRLGDGVPHDIGPLLSAVLESVQRTDWIETGAVVKYALPVQPAAKTTTVGADAVRDILLNVHADALHAAFAGGRLSITDVTLRGEVGPLRLAWNAYNVKDQHIVVTLDARAYRADLESQELGSFHGVVLGLFRERCAPFVGAVLAHRGLHEYLDLDYLRRGTRLPA